MSNQWSASVNERGAYLAAVENKKKRYRFRFADTFGGLWFWYDEHTPALLSFEQFHELKDCLSEQDRSKYLKTWALGAFMPDNKISSSDLRTREEAEEKLSAILIERRQSDPIAFHHEYVQIQIHIGGKFKGADADDALQALLDIYTTVFYSGVVWTKALMADGEKAYVVSSVSSKISGVLRKNEVTVLSPVFVICMNQVRGVFGQPAVFRICTESTYLHFSSDGVSISKLGTDEGNA